MNFIRRLMGSQPDGKPETDKPEGEAARPASSAAAPMPDLEVMTPATGTPTAPAIPVAAKPNVEASPDAVMAAATAKRDTLPMEVVDPLAPTTPLAQTKEALPTEPDAFKTAKLDPKTEGGYMATRQFTEPTTYTTKPGRHLIGGWNSDPGMVRTNNEDALFTFFSSHMSAGNMPDFGLFVVADGMGGHENGERASALATRAIARAIINSFYLKLLDEDVTEDDRPIISEALAEAVQQANDVISSKTDGGTTVTAAAIVGDLAYVAHVGDSRAYLVTGEKIEQITRDHSLVQRLIELDQLTPEEAATHPQRSVLYRAIGQSESVEIDTITRRLPAGARLMICSDGLWSFVPEAQLHSTILASRSPQEACDKLIKLANDSGGNDNITVVVIQVPN